MRRSDPPAPLSAAKAVEVDDLPGLQRSTNLGATCDEDGGMVEGARAYGGPEDGSEEYRSGGEVER